MRSTRGGSLRAARSRYQDSKAERTFESRSAPSRARGTSTSNCQWWKTDRDLVTVGRVDGHQHGSSEVGERLAADEAARRQGGRGFAVVADDPARAAPHGGLEVAGRNVGRRCDGDEAGLIDRDLYGLVAPWAADDLVVDPGVAKADLAALGHARRRRATSTTCLTSSSSSSSS